MQIVIEIDEERYSYVKNQVKNGIDNPLKVIIANGRPLPKGHGRLIDADDIDNHIVGSVDTRDCPTIIEADKEERGMTLELDEAIKRFIDNAEYERTRGSLEGCLEFKQLAEWLKELKEVREHTRWIPVSERLPEDGTWNLWTDGEKISVERYKMDAIDHFFPQGIWFDFENAIAWMPLPEPYRESERKE